jgi:vacuolar-type H+-ATPase subunit H
MEPKTPKEEAEDLVDDLVADKRSQIKDKHSKIIEETVEELETIREMNVVFSEIRREMDGGDEE